MIDEDGIDECNIDFDEVVRESDKEFIDDGEIDESVADHYAFTNVTRDYTEAVKDSLSDFDFDQEPNNDCNENEIWDLSIDNFKDYKSKVESFTKTLINPKGLNNKDSFFYSILFALTYHLKGKVTECEDDEINEDTGSEIFNEIYPLKNMVKLGLDILNFENQCFEISQILNKNSFICAYLN